MDDTCNAVYISDRGAPTLACEKPAGFHLIHRDPATGVRYLPHRRACARHVANLTATKLAALAVAGAATGIRLSPRRVAVAMAADALTHYVIDRRAPLRRLATVLGKDEFYHLGDPCAAPCGTGAYALDQSAHLSLLALAALYAGR